MSATNELSSIQHELRSPPAINVPENDVDIEMGQPTTLNISTANQDSLNIVITDPNLVETTQEQGNNSKLWTTTQYFCQTVVNVMDLVGNSLVSLFGIHGDYQYVINAAERLENEDEAKKQEFPNN